MHQLIPPRALRTVLLAAPLLLGAAGCSSPTEPVTPGVLLVDASAVVASMSGDWLSIEIPVTETRREPAGVHFSQCGSYSLERSTATGWTEAWRPICFLPVLPTSEVVERSSAYVVTVSASRGPNAAPVWVLPDVSGTYRLVRTGIAATVFGGMRNVRLVSNEFAVSLP